MSGAVKPNTRATCWAWPAIAPWRCTTNFGALGVPDVVKKSDERAADRLIFFSDAVVAIAITLLALDLRVDHTAGDHLQFRDILAHWKTFAAFFLSFFNIATFWKSHHLVFTYIAKIDDRLMWFHIRR